MLQLYSFCLSSASWRVRIGLAYKGLTYDYQPVHLRKRQQADAEYAALNPMQQVPTLVLPDGKRLTQSVAILEWLEEIYPEPPLLPRDPYWRAKTRLLVEIVNSGIQPLQNTGVTDYVRDHGGDAAEFARHFVGKGVTALEAVVRDTAGWFAVGDHVTMADVFIVPQLDKARQLGVVLDACPTLLGIEQEAQKLEAFVQARPEVQPDYSAL